MSGRASFMLGFFVGSFVMTLVLCWVLSDSVHKQQVIEHGAAYYHPETGEFTWRNQAAAAPPETEE